MLFRRPDRSVDGSPKVSALSNRSVEGSAGADSDKGSDGEALGEVSIISGNADAVVDTLASTGSVAWDSEWPSSTVMVVMRGDELVKYPA